MDDVNSDNCCDTLVSHIELLETCCDQLRTSTGFLQSQIDSAESCCDALRTSTQAKH